MSTIHERFNALKSQGPKAETADRNIGNEVVAHVVGDDGDAGQHT